MTKKHLEAFAKAAREQLSFERKLPASASERERYGEQCYASGVASMCGLFADIVAQDNPRFDRARFLEACGV